MCWLCFTVVLMVAILVLALFSIFKDRGDRSKCIFLTFASTNKLESL